MHFQTNNLHRLEGLDLARFLAFVGMVIVNFKTVMVSVGEGGGNFSGIADMLQGRAAATFVVLASIGLGLGAARHDWHQTLATTLKRAAFLLVVGLVNLQIFDADIIHYYAFYFLFGAFFLRRSWGLLSVSIAVLIAGFMVLIFLLDYDTGWNWNTYAYSDIWTLKGFRLLGSVPQSGDNFGLPGINSGPISLPMGGCVMRKGVYSFYTPTASPRWSLSRMTGIS